MRKFKKVLNCESSLKPIHPFFCNKLKKFSKNQKLNELLKIFLYTQFNNKVVQAKSVCLLLPLKDASVYQ